MESFGIGLLIGVTVGAVGGFLLATHLGTIRADVAAALGAQKATAQANVHAALSQIANAAGTIATPPTVSLASETLAPLAASGVAQADASTSAKP